MRDLRMRGLSLGVTLLLAVAAGAGFAHAQTNIPQAAATTCAVMSGQRKADPQALQYLLLLEEDIGEGNPVAIALQREVIKQCPKAFLDFQQRKRVNNPFPPGSLVVNSGVPLVKQEVPLVKPGGSLVGSGVSLVKPGTSLYRPDKVLVLTETDREIRVTVAADLLFDFDKATIRPDGALALRQLAVVLRGKKNDAVSIEGHTDSIGSNAYNMRLSLQRATAVKTWLAKNEGFNVAMFRTQGFGATRPVASNTKPDGTDNPDGRQLNRRVELVIRK